MYVGVWALLPEMENEGLEKALNRYREAGFEHIIIPGGVTDVHPEHYRGTSIDPMKTIAPSEAVYASGAKTRRDVIKAVTDHGLVYDLVVGVGGQSGLIEKYPHVANTDIFGERSSIMMCLNNPDGRNFILGQIEDILSHYDVYGVELDVIYVDHHTRMTVKPDPPPALYPLHHLAPDNCFCEHCMKLAGEKGLNVEGLRKTVMRLVQASKKLSYDRFKRYTDTFRGMYDVVRFLLDYPELVDWLRFRCDTITQFTADVKDIARGIDPKLVVSVDTLSPSFSWTMGQDYRSLSKVADHLKLLLFTRCIGAREAKPLRPLMKAIPEASDEEIMDLLYRMWGFQGPRTLDEFAGGGVDPANTYYQVRCAKEETGFSYPIVAGIGASESASPEHVKKGVEMAFKAQADGVCVHTWYGGTDPKSIAAVGEALKELGIR